MTEVKAIINRHPSSTLPLNLLFRCIVVAAACLSVSGHLLRYRDREAEVGLCYKLLSAYALDAYDQSGWHHNLLALA